MPIPNLDDPILKHARTDQAPLSEEQTVAEALARIRANPPGGRAVYFYVVDREDRLVGVVPTRRMLLSEPGTKVADIMIGRVAAIPYTATVMHACELFTLHKFLAFPVVDEHRHFLGVVDIELYTDEVADLAARTDYDDLFQLVGVRMAANASPLAAYRQRFPWLLCNIGGGLLAAFLTGMYQEVLDRLIVLALFIPVVLTLAESVSIQSVSLALQALHGGVPAVAEALRRVRRELVTGLLLGLSSGVLVGLVCWLWKGETRVGLAIAASITLSVALSALIGLSLPLALSLLRRDPKVAAGPIALVSADLATLVLYFNLAKWMLT